MHAANIAKEVFRKYNLDRFDLGNGKLVVNKPRPVQDHSQLFTGVHYSYQMKLTAFELVGGKDKATFHSESFLGKEPVRASCWQNICAAMGQASCNDSMDITVYDNGC